MHKILTIGSSMQDIFIQYNATRTPDIHATAQDKTAHICMPAGRKIEVDNIVYYCGGGGTNSAVSFARAGFNVEAFFTIGDDHAGTFILDTLHKEHVATPHVITSKNTPTGNSFIIPGPQGNNAVLVYRGANLTLTAQDIPQDAIAHTDHLYITSLSGPTAPLLLPITQCAKKYNKPVAVNPGTSQLRAGADYLHKALAHIDILILNKYEAELLTTIISPETTNFEMHHFFKTVHACGPHIVVMTDGARGVYASNETTIYFHPSIPTTVISSTGAGDAFGSCFVAQLINGASIEHALRAGIINSASVIGRTGTQTGLLTTKEIDQRINLVDQSLLKKYRL